MRARLVYVVEWREDGAWRFRVFTGEPAALSVMLRVANRVAMRRACSLPRVLPCLPGDVRMLRAGADRERVA